MGKHTFFIQIDVTFEPIMWFWCNIRLKKNTDTIYLWEKEHAQTRQHCNYYTESALGLIQRNLPRKPKAFNAEILRETALMGRVELVKICLEGIDNTTMLLLLLIVINVNKGIYGDIVTCIHTLITKQSM